MIMCIYLNVFLLYSRYFHYDLNLFFRGNDICKRFSFCCNLWPFGTVWLDISKLSDYGFAVWSYCHRISIYNWTYFAYFSSLRCLIFSNQFLWSLWKSFELFLKHVFHFLPHFVNVTKHGRSKTKPTSSPKSFEPFVKILIPIVHIITCSAAYFNRP